MPRADDVPSFKVDTRETPCTHNPLGVKGCGEAGAIGAPGGADERHHRRARREGPGDARHRADRVETSCQEKSHARIRISPSASDEGCCCAWLRKKTEGRYLAGGQSLVQAMKLRLSSPTDLIDLGTIKELAGIKASGSAVEIGAMTRHADVAGSKPT